MSRLNRRRFTWVATSGIASAALVGCGEAVDEDLTPTRIPDVAGAPPTLAPQVEPFESEEGAEEDVAEEAAGEEVAAEEEAPQEEVVAGEEEGAAGEEQAVADAAAVQTITVQALDSLAFDPSDFEATPGQEIHVVNAGSLQHDFVVDELELATELLNGGEEETITVPDDAEIGQSYTYYCSVPGHREAGMEGTMVIVEAGAAGGVEEEAVAEEPDAAATPEDEAPADGEEAGAAGAAVTVQALDSLAFDPSEFEVSPGQEIRVVNAGVLQHDFVVDEMDLATELLNGGEEATITVPEDAEPGEYIFYCSVPGHRPGGMEGTMTVMEGGGVAADDTGETTEAAASPEEPAAAAAAEGAITVEALDSLAFDPSSFTASPGQEIHVVNVGVLQHDFVIDELELATELLNGGEEATVTVPEDAEPGEYVFYCSVPGHREAGMEGTMTIE